MPKIIFISDKEVSNDESIYIANICRSLGFKDFLIYDESYFQTNKCYDYEIAILLGKTVAEKYIDNFSSIKRSEYTILESNIIDKPCLVTYSVSQVLFSLINNDEEDENDELEDDEEDEVFKIDLSKSLTNTITIAFKYVNGEFVNLNAIDIQTAQTYDEFYNYYINNLKDKSIVAFDIESNAVDVRQEDFEIIGYSFSPDKTTGIYVVKKALEYSISDEDWIKCVELSKNILDNSTGVIHNTMYEVPALVNNWDYYLKKMEDTLCMARLLQGGKTGAGLKYQAKVKLGYPEWDKDLDIYKNSFLEVINGLKPTIAGKARWEFEYIQENSLLDLLKMLKEAKNIESDVHSLAIKEKKANIKKLKTLVDKLDESFDKLNKGTTKKKTVNIEKISELLKKLDIAIDFPIELTLEDYNIKDKICSISYQLISEDTPVITYTDRTATVHKNLNSIIKVVRVYYEDDELDNILDIIKRELINMVSMGFNRNIIPYNLIPMKLLSKYGAVDAIATIDLYDKLCEELTTTSNNEVDLWKGYDLIKRQFKLGYHLEMAGLFWNDEVASNYKKKIDDRAWEVMKEMLLSGFVDDSIFEGGSNSVGEYLLSNEFSNISSILGDIIIVDENYIKLNGKRLKISNIYSELETTKQGREFLVSIKNSILDYIKSKITLENYPTFKDLKKFFNPFSAKVQAKFLNDLYNDYEFKIAKILMKLFLYIKTSDFDFGKMTNSVANYYTGKIEVEKFNGDDEILLNWICRVSKHNDSDSDLEKIKYTDIFRKGKKLLTESRFSSRYLKTLVSDCMTTVIDSAKDSVTIEIHDILVYQGNNANDESTWSDKFRFLVNYRSYKKLVKIVNTYLSGKKVGRGAVWEVEKKDLDDCKLISKRKKLYNSDNLKDDDREYILQSQWQVCCADTLRWRSGIHCWHPDTKIRLTDGRDLTIKDLYKEFKSGKNNYVYSRSEIDQKLIIELIRDVYISHKTNKMIKVTLDNGESFESTLDHKMVMRDGSYKESQNLQVGDSLYPINFRIDDTNHEQIFDPDLNEFVLCHYLSDEYNEKYNLLRDMSNDHFGKNGAWCRHHEDFNPLNNNPDNINRYGWNSHDEIHKSSEGRKKTWERMKYRMSIDKEYHDKLMSGFQKKGYYSMVLSPNAYKIRHAAGMTYVKRTNSDKNEIAKRVRGSILSSIKKMLELGYDVKEDNYDDITEKDDFRSVCGNYRKLKTIYTHFIDKKFSEIVELAKNWNHKVINIEFVSYDKPIDVYSIAIYSDSPSYSLSCGILSKNTLPSDVLIKDIYTSRFNGGIIIAPDFSQLEIRILAGLSNCKSLLEAFEKGEDIHLNTAVNVFKKPHSEITKGERRSAKNCTFNLIYGGKAKGIAEAHLNGDIDLAEKIINGFFTGYPEAKQLMDKCHRDVEKFGRVECSKVGGHFLYIDVNGKQGVEGAKRQAFNYIIQSFIGSTKIKGLDGTSRTIEDLAQNINNEYWVLSYDNNKNKIIPMKGIKPQCTGITKEYCKITLGNNKYFEVTPEHKCMMISGKYVKAEDLKINDYLMPVYIENDNHKIIKVEHIILDKPIKKYDLEVPIHHNFALDCGVFVHNSQGSFIGGYVMSMINDYIIEKGYKSVPISFIHDSLEFDIHPDEFVDICKYVEYVMNKIPIETFGIPTKADLEIGISMGQGVEAHFKEISDDQNEFKIEVEGEQSRVDMLVKQWESVYNNVLVTELETSQKENPMTNLFVRKASFSFDLGKSKTHVKKLIEVKIK
jgi:DNA polymerase I - 3''-5'' exonuclease and polymerase domains